MAKPKRIVKAKKNRQGLLVRPGGGNKAQARANAKRKRERVKYSKKQSRTSKRVSSKNPSGKTLAGRVIKKFGTKIKNFVMKGTGYRHQGRRR